MGGLGFGSQHLLFVETNEVEFVYLTSTFATLLEQMDLDPLPGVGVEVKAGRRSEVLQNQQRR
jgi:hypothetical protein